ncbi:MAG: hypothetical protein UT83_C0018G0001 [Parcubacteria group bacterium GW2011_GWA2_40_143]|nr:MAG: hypothetical protein UT83_C0018G0001 [Parcubacteria group bacterium GW2011_GWA2_40_143]
MLKVKNIKKSYGETTILAGISFAIERGHKIALVGENGAGKTTLLKIIAGLVEQDAGLVETVRGARVGYLPQSFMASGKETALEYLRKTSGINEAESFKNELETKKDFSKKDKVNYNEALADYKRLGGYSFEHKAKNILVGLGLKVSDADKNLATLSSGQKSKIALAGILLKGADLLLMDEPTNNLDIPALIWLEDFIKNSMAACIMVSHDRRFLDNTMNKVMELNKQTRTINITGGTYSNYLITMFKKTAREKEQYRLQKEEISRLNDLAARKREAAKKGAKWIGTDNDKFLIGFKRNRAGSKTDIGIKLTKVEIGYKDGSFKAGPFSLEIKRDDKIGIMGNNGSGKSTLLKTIAGLLPALSGELIFGADTKIGNLTQEHENLPERESLGQFLIDKGGVKPQEVFPLLAQFGFKDNKVKENIGALSPGEKTRLLFALFQTMSVNVLLLDEPTNHLDADAIDALEEMLTSYKGAVALVSHDRYFLEKINLDKTYILSEGKLSVIPHLDHLLAS